nr:CoA-binding protein [Ignavibacterium sp.]
MQNESIKSFLNSKKIAVVGVSSKNKGFGVTVYHHPKDNGYNVFGVNKNGGFSDSVKLYNSISMIDAKIDGVITVVPPSET